MNLTKDTYSFVIQPNEYLLYDVSSNTCRSLITNNTEEEAFVLGTPFFRSFNIILNYNTTEITIFDLDKYEYGL